MGDDPSQTKFNYKDWFEEQDRNTQIDIIGAARYKEFINGKEVTSFAKDGKVMSLKELGIDRTTRQKVFEMIYKDSAIPHKLTEKEINDLYNDKLTDKELQDIFKRRYTYIEIDIVGKMTREQMQILFRTYDNLLQDYPVGSKLMSIDVATMRESIRGKYVSGRSAIIFNRSFVNGDILEIINKNKKQFSTNKINHVYIHEFAHAIDRAINKNGKIGRQLLLQRAYVENKNNKELEKAWIDFAKEISSYAETIPKIKVLNKDTNKYKYVNIDSSMYGGEFFAEAFTAWRAKKIPVEMQWLIDFFESLRL